jgi:hypothetical protein
MRKHRDLTADARERLCSLCSHTHTHTHTHTHLQRATRLLRVRHLDFSGPPTDGGVSRYSENTSSCIAGTSPCLRSPDATHNTNSTPVTQRTLSSQRTLCENRRPRCHVAMKRYTKPRGA